MVFHPNPTTGKISINLGKDRQGVNIVIKNINGQKVFNKDFGSTDSVNIEILGAKGLYSIEIRTKNGTNAILKVLKN